MVFDLIKSKEEELRLAMINSEVEKLDELISDSLVFTGPNGALVTKSIDLDVHRSKIQKISELKPSEQEIQTYDDWAIVTVRMDLVGFYREIDVSGPYRYLRIWAKINESWKIVAGSVVSILE